METCVAENPKSSNGKTPGRKFNSLEDDIKSLQSQQQKIQSRLETLESREKKLKSQHDTLIDDALSLEGEQLILSDDIRSLQSAQRSDDIKSLQDGRPKIDRIQKMVDNLKEMADYEFRMGKANYEIDFKNWIESESNKIANRGDSQGQAASSHQPDTYITELARRAGNLTTKDLEDIGIKNAEKYGKLFDNLAEDVEKMRGLIQFCRGLFNDEALKRERDYWEPLIILKEGKSIEEILKEHDEDRDPVFGYARI